MAAPNDTTKFELAWLIIWIVVSAALLVLALLRKLSLPHLLRGPKQMAQGFAFLQLAIFAMYLAAMAHDVWTKIGAMAFGVAGSHSTDGADDNFSRYSCDGYSGQDNKNYCNTMVTAGAFTLIFGLVGMVASAALTLLVLADVAGRSLKFSAHVPMLANVQWVCLQAQMIIWAVSAHDPLVQGSPAADFKLGASWILCIVCTILAIVAAMFFAGGAGVSTSAGAPANTAPAATGPTTVQANPNMPPV